MRNIWPLVCLVFIFGTLNAQTMDLQAYLNSLCKDITCGDGYHCYAGGCIPDFQKIDKCLLKSCQYNQKCIDGECVEIKNIDPCKLCPTGTKCGQNQCVITPDVCKYVTCPDNYYCSAGGCYKKQEKCKKNQDCSQSQQCFHGVCRTIKIQYCQQQCTKGTRCYDGSCVKNNYQEFSVADQIENQFLCEIMSCGVGLECVEGQCIPEPIFFDKNCYLYPCQNPNDICYFGSCIYKDILGNSQLIINDDSTSKQCTTPCKQDQKCVNKICVKNQNIPGVPDLCKEKVCDKGLVCQFGQCLPQSLFNGVNCYLSPCPAGKICNFGTCVQNKIQRQNSGCSDKCTSEQSLVNGKCHSVDEDMKNFCNGINCKSNQTCVFGQCVPSQFQNLCKKTSCQSDQYCFFGICFAKTIRKNAVACSKVKCETGAICANGKCNYLLKLFENLCDEVKCGQGQVCMYGNCVDEKIKAQCNSIKCDQSSICMFGQCFPIFNAFDIFTSNCNKSSSNQINSQSNPLNTVDNSNSVPTNGFKPPVFNPSIPPNFNLNGQCKPACTTGQMCVLGSCYTLPGQN